MLLQIKRVLSDAKLAVPFVMIVTTAWLYLQKRRDSEIRLTNNMIARNAVFVGIIVGVVLYSCTAVVPLSEHIRVGPADF